MTNPEPSSLTNPPIQNPPDSPPPQVDISQQTPSAPSPHHKTSNLIVFLVALILFTTLGSIFVLAYHSTSLINLLGQQRLAAAIPFITKATPAPTPAPSPSPTPGTTYNWITYEDPALGVRFKHPDNWDTYYLGGDSVLMIAPQQNIDEVAQIDGGFGGGPFLIMTIQNTGSSPRQIPPPTSDEFQQVTRSQTKIGGATADKYEIEVLMDSPLGRPGDQLFLYLISHGEDYYHINLLDMTYEDIYNQIFSTLEFIPTNISDWQTYTDPTLNFSINYPNGWRKVEMPTGVGFGPVEVQEDVVWTINKLNKNEYTLEEIKDDFGKQFTDRQQIEKGVSFNDIDAISVVTTTPSISDWYSETIILETNQYWITISNGAITNFALQQSPGVQMGTTFESFYTSLQFTSN